MRWVVIAALAAVTAGCEAELVCGTGTLEVDGACVPADGVTPESNTCGPGTHYDAVTQSCVSDTAPTECGPNTVPELGDDGVTVCVGAGGDACSLPIECPEPDATRVAVCGQLFDLETTQRLAADGATGVPCDPAAPASAGPCSLMIAAFDALAVSGGPDGVTPLAADEVMIDDCGRYRIANARRPTTGLLALALDDVTDTGSFGGEPVQDAVLVSITGFPVDAGEARAGQRAFAVRYATDEAWTASAGRPFGDQGFGERGVFVPIFLHGDDPVPGVTVTVAGAPDPDDDFYFADADPLSRAEVDVELAVTGANGTALIVDSSVLQHGGQGGEPPGCVWPSGPAASVPGVVSYQERRARIATDPEALCP